MCTQPFRYVQVALFALACFFVIGCEASFDDLRPESEALVPQDPLPEDMGEESESDATGTDALPDDDVLPDDDADSDEGDDPVEIASGTFEGRGGYGASGSASIWKVGSSWEVRLNDDFVVDSVPGPVMVLTQGSSLGSSIDASRGDLELGVLESNQGTSVFDIGADPGDRFVLWVFCKPFGLEVARAQLEEL